MRSAEAWKRLESEHDDIVENLIFKFLMTPQLPIDLYIAIKHPEKQKMLILRIKSKQFLQLENFPELHALEIINCPLPGDPHEYETIRLVLKDVSYFDLFCVLSDDIINATKKMENQEQMIKTFFSRLHAWINFLTKCGPTGLGKESARGLFGELWFLSEYLLKNNLSTLINGWTGPKGTPQDFQFPETAVEVKTTIMKQPQKIKINSELQLDDRGIKQLFIFYLSILERKGDGLTLPDIIAHIRIYLKDDSTLLNLFNELLFISGYLDDHANYYSTTSYVIRNESFFLISEGFPRLIEKDLPSGVGDLKYSIDVSKCSKFFISSDTFLRLLNNPMG